MRKKWSMWVTCPVCATGYQLFGAFGCLRRRCTLTCKHCGQKLVSELSVGTYAVLAIYTTLVAMIIGVPFVLALTGRQWLAAAAMGLILLLCVILPYMIGHARSTAKDESQIP